MKEQSKSTYTVQIPIAGFVSFEVEAASEKEAKEAAWACYNESNFDETDVQWEAFDSITQGNVCHAPLHEIDVYKHKEK